MTLTSLYMELSEKLEGKVIYCEGVLNKYRFSLNCGFCS